MSQSAWQDPVLSHGPLQVIVPDRVWMVTGRLPRGPLSRNMVIYRRSSGGLLLHSPIALEETAQKALEALGPIEAIIVPNGMHRLDGPRYKARYPQIKVLCPRAARTAVEAKVNVDAVCEDALPQEGIGVHAADGLKPMELCYELPTDQGRVLVVTDMLMNMPDQPGFGGWILKTIGTSGFFGMTGIARMMMLRDRAAFKAWLRKMSEKKPGAILVAHGKPVLENASQALLAAEARL